MLRPVAFRSLPFCRFSKPRSLIVLAAVLAGGCSADIGRFNSPAFNFDDNPANTSDPVPSAPVRRNIGGPVGQEPNLASDARVEPLPGRPVMPVASARPLPPVQPTEPRRMTVPAQYRPPATASARQPQPIAKAEQIEVQPGDTIYGLSKRHHVPIANLMSVNELRNPTIKPGQRLYLPVRQPDFPAEEAQPSARMPAGREPVETASVSARPSGIVNAEGTYTIKPGDNLYGIARAHRVTVADLQKANGITNVRNMKPGMVLKMPSASAAQAEAAPALAPPAPRLSQAEAAPAAQATAARFEEPKREAALKLPDYASDVTPSDAQVPPIAKPAVEERPVPQPQSAKLRWPARGRIIAAFGARPDGTHNDGINVAVPLGTEVHAAENGSVHYAGSELKSYGNLVLLKHDNGWVTAYAHNDQILVKRGDRVQRGQVISRAGKSGSVDQPQIHFELRQEAKPVDPMPHLEKL